MIYEAIDRWNSPSLEHHGVKGMKWGVRHDPKVDKLRSSIRQAKRARNKLYRSDLAGSAAITRSPYDKFAKASNLVADRKAKLAKYKKGDKGELNSYAKSLNGMKTDSNALMLHLQTTRGKKYAQKVYQRSQDRMLRGILAGSAVVAGGLAVAAILASRTPTPPLKAPNINTFKPASFAYDTFRPASFAYDTFKHL